MSKYLLFLAVLLFVGLFSSCQEELGEIIPDRPSTTQPDEDHNSGTDRILENLGEPVNQADLLKFVNEYRAKGCKCGNTYYPPAKPVTWNNKLELAAQLHSSDMKMNNFVSHTGADGGELYKRLNNVKYEFVSYGENLAKGPQTERVVVDAWVDSPKHCKNIMNNYLKEMGVGRVGTYWTQVFGTQPF